MQEKYGTVNAAPPEPLSNIKHKTIYPSSLIFTKKVSLDKVSDSEYVTTKTMNKRTGGMGQLPGKKNICHQKKFSQTSSMAESLVESRQKIEVE